MSAPITPQAVADGLGQLTMDVYCTEEETRVIRRLQRILERLESFESDGDMPGREPNDGAPVFGDQIEIDDDNITDKAPCTGIYYGAGRTGAAAVFVDEMILVSGKWVKLNYGWRCVR